MKTLKVVYEIESTVETMFVNNVHGTWKLLEDIDHAFLSYYGSNVADSKATLIYVMDNDTEILLHAPKISEPIVVNL